jgi:hypothetical protein
MSWKPAYPTTLSKFHPWCCWQCLWVCFVVTDYICSILVHPFKTFVNKMYCKQLTLNKVIVSKNYHMAHMHAKISLALYYMMFLTFLTSGFHWKVTLIGAPSVLQFENSREFANYTAACKIIGLNLKLCLGKCDTIKTWKCWDESPRYRKHVNNVVASYKNPYWSEGLWFS